MTTMTSTLNLMHHLSSRVSLWRSQQFEPRSYFADKIPPLLHRHLTLVAAGAQSNMQMCIVVVHQLLLQQTHLPHRREQPSCLARYVSQRQQQPHCVRLRLIADCADFHASLRSHYAMDFDPPPSWVALRSLQHSLPCYVPHLVEHSVALLRA